MTHMRAIKSTDLIGHIKFLPWRQLEGCNMTRPFLSAKGVTCETNEHKQEFYIVSQAGKGLDKLSIQIVFHHIISCSHGASLSSQTHFRKRGKGLVNCEYKPCPTGMQLAR